MFEVNYKKSEEKSINPISNELTFFKDLPRVVSVVSKERWATYGLKGSISSLRDRGR